MSRAFVGSTIGTFIAATAALTMPFDAGMTVMVGAGTLIVWVS